MRSFNNNNAIILINPKAGPKRIIEISDRIHRFSRYFDYAVFEDIDEFRNFIISHLNSYDFFIAAGGDGTVNSLASELTGTGKILAVLPVGSGNGFAREMGFRKSIRKLIMDIRGGGSFDIDVLYINGKPCFNLTGLGIDSFVAHDFSNSDRRGFWSYFAAAVRVVFKLKPVKTEIRFENRTITEDVFMLSVTNTRQFGNHAIIAPEAVPHDGLLNIVVVKPFPKILMPAFAIRLLTGTLKESRYINYFSSPGPVTINTVETRYHIDGEPVNINSPVTITLRKKALKVLVTRRNKWLKGN